MANIMLTDSCNLHCPYCFANEFVNHSANEISIENLKKSMDFIATARDERLGLIGGEPTLHSKFKEILQMIIADNRFSNVILYTNGVKLDEFINELAHPKFHILWNCNNPTDMGKAEFERMCDNLELYINKFYIGNGVTSISSNAFYGCRGLKEIHFTGTKAQWNAIKKVYNWSSNTGSYTIYCTDGTISKS